jgi:hypothetical protein
MRRGIPLLYAGLAVIVVVAASGVRAQETGKPEAAPARLKLADCQVTVLGQTTADPLTLQRGTTMSKESPAPGWRFVALTVKIEKPQPGALYVNSRDFLLAYEREAAGQVYERHEGCIAIERLGPEEPKDFAPGTLQAREGFFDPIGFPDQSPKSSVMYLRLAFQVHADTSKADLCIVAPKVPVELGG